MIVIGIFITCTFWRG